MTDKDAKNADKHEMENPLFEEDLKTDPANEGVKLDALQDDFNALISGSEGSGSEPSYTQSSTPQISDPQPSDYLSAESQGLTDPVPEQNTFEQNAFEQPASTEQPTHYEEATDAFNDLADAFTVDSAPASGANNNDGFSSHLDQSFDEFESNVTPHQVQSEEIDHFSATVQDIAEDKFSAFDRDEHTPTSSYPISGDSIPSQSSDSLSEDSSPIHADLSGKNASSFLNMPTMALAVTVLVVAGAGIYLLTKTTNDKPVQIIQGELLEMPEQENLSSRELTEEHMQTASPSNHSEQHDTITSESERSNSFTQTETAIPASLSTEDAIKLITQKRARDAAQSSDSMGTNSMDKIETASGAAQQATQPQTAAPMQAASTPETLSTTPMSTSNDNGDWVIIAPVISKPSALRYVKSFTAKGIESEILHRTNKGLDKYSVRILGFNSQQDAEKQIKRLSMLGLRNAKVLKATSTLQGNRIAAQESTSTAPRTMPSSATADAQPKLDRAAIADQNPEIAETEFAQQTAAPDKVKATPKTSKTPQPLQLVSEFDLDDEYPAQSNAIQQASELDARPDQHAASKADFKRIGRADTQLLEQLSDIDGMPTGTPEAAIRLQTPSATHASMNAAAPAFKQAASLSSDPLIRAREIYSSLKPASAKSGHSSIRPSRPSSFTRAATSHRAPTTTIRRSSAPAYQRPVSTASLDTTKHWTIVAPVDSKEKAEEYVDLFHSKYMESEAVELNVNGEMRHFVYIKGFTNRLSAQKRRDRLVNQSILENTADIEEL